MMGAGSNCSADSKCGVGSNRGTASNCGVGSNRGWVKVVLTQTAVLVQIVVLAQSGTDSN